MPRHSTPPVIAGLTRNLVILRRVAKSMPPVIPRPFVIAGLTRNLVILRGVIGV